MSSFINDTRKHKLALVKIFIITFFSSYMCFPGEIDNHLEKENTRLSDIFKGDALRSARKVLRDFGLAYNDTKRAVGLISGFYTYFDEYQEYEKRDEESDQSNPQTEEISTLQRTTDGVIASHVGEKLLGLPGAFGFYLGYNWRSPDRQVGPRRRNNSPILRSNHDVMLSFEPVQLMAKSYYIMGDITTNINAVSDRSGEIDTSFTVDLDEGGNYIQVDLNNAKKMYLISNLHGKYSRNNPIKKHPLYVKGYRAPHIILSSSPVILSTEHGDLDENNVLIIAPSVSINGKTITEKNRLEAIARFFNDAKRLEQVHELLEDVKFSYIRAIGTKDISERFFGEAFCQQLEDYSDLSAVNDLIQFSEKIFEHFNDEKK